LSLREIARVIREPWDVVVDRFGKPPPAGIGSDDYFAYLEQGTAIATERGSLARMERLGREIELRYLRLTRYAVFGHEPLFVFYLLRENELRNLRQLHAAKLADFPDEVVAETVAWVG
jgi:vacuolar-type H+-ATPase subunit C/Vma6